MVFGDAFGVNRPDRAASYELVPGAAKLARGEQLVDALASDAQAFAGFVYANVFFRVGLHAGILRARY